MNDVKNDRAGLRVLEENEIAAVSGGFDPIITAPTDADKAKTADKAFNAMNGYTKG